MKEIVVKPVSKDNLPEMAEWLQKNYDKNGLDPNILTYPNLEILRAEKLGEEAICYLPFHGVIMLESSAPNPQANRLERAIAFKELVKVTVFMAAKSGIKEIYFLQSDPEISKLASRHGFEKIQVPVYRLKI